MKKGIIIIVVVILVAGGLAAALFLRPANKVDDETTQNTQELEQDPRNAGPAQVSSQSDSPSSGNVQLAEGRFVDYSEDKAAASGYRDTILSFYAAWCPECRAFEQALNDASIPGGVQILKVNYDTAEDLKQKYEVTIQSTFVKVSSDGTFLSRWVGYEREKSLGAILGNT